jgi:hypothetical protein
MLPYFVVGFTRLVLTDPLGYILGRQHGDAALQWAEEKLGDEAGFIRKVERFFRKAAPVVILIAPNLYMCILAGATGMKARVFFALNIIGTLGRLTLFWVAGDAFREELEAVLEFIQRFQLPLINACRDRRGDRGDRSRGRSRTTGLTVVVEGEPGIFPPPVTALLRRLFGGPRSRPEPADRAVRSPETEGGSEDGERGAAPPPA